MNNYNPAPQRTVWWEVFGVYVITYHELFDWGLKLHGEDIIDIAHIRAVVEAAGFNW